MNTLGHLHIRIFFQNTNYMCNTHCVYNIEKRGLLKYELYDFYYQ